MKRFIFFTFISLILCGAKYPERPINFVSDFANVIDDNYETKINEFLAELKEKTGAEVAVVTVESSEGEDFVIYGVNLFRKWGIGEKGKDNGVLIIDFVKDRYIRIEVGYGLEGIIPDGLAGEIRDKFYRPYLSKGQYGPGHYYGALAIALRIADAYNVKLNSTKDVTFPRARSRSNTIETFPLFFILFVIILFFIPFFRNPRVIKKGGITIFWGGFGGGGGFSGGGFGGFGGGSSGGAGAGGHY